MGKGPASLPEHRSPSVLIRPANLVTGLRSCQLHSPAGETDHWVTAAEPVRTFPCLSCLSTEPTCHPRFPCSDPSPPFSFLPLNWFHPFLLVLNFSTFDSPGTSELMKCFYIYHHIESLPGRDGEVLKIPSNCQVFLLKMQNFPKTRNGEAGWRQRQLQRQSIPSSAPTHAQATQALRRWELGMGAGRKDHSGRRPPERVQGQATNLGVLHIKALL